MTILGLDTSVQFTRMNRFLQPIPLSTHGAAGGWRAHIGKGAGTPFLRPPALISATQLVSVACENRFLYFIFPPVLGSGKMKHRDDRLHVSLSVSGTLAAQVGRCLTSGKDFPAKEEGQL